MELRLDGELRDLRQGGWVTIGEVDLTNDKEDEARRLNCTHILRDGKPESIKTGLSS